MDAIYHRTHLGDSLLHALQKLCVAGELEGAEARRIITDFNEVMAEELRSPNNSGIRKAQLTGTLVRYNIANMQRNPRNSAWTGQGGPTGFLHLTDAALTIRGKLFPLAGTTQLGVRRRIEGAPEVAPTGRKRARSMGEPDNNPGRASSARYSGIGGGDRDTEDKERGAGGDTRGGNAKRERGVLAELKLGKRKRKRLEAEGELGKIEGFGGDEQLNRGRGGGRDGRRKGALNTSNRSVRRQQDADERNSGAESESDSEVDHDPDRETSDDDLDALTKELDGMDSSDGVDNWGDDDVDRDVGDDGGGDGKNSGINQSSSTAAPNTEGERKEGSEEGGGSHDSESSDSDESSGSIGAAALEFEEFLGTIKGGVGGGGRGLKVDAGGTGVEDADIGKVEADGEEGFSEASPPAGAGGVARDRAVSQDDAEVLAPKPAVGGLLRGNEVTPSREGGSSTSRVGASSSDEGPSEGELEKGRERRVAAATSERDCKPYFSDNGGGGGGSDADDAGDMDDKEEEEEGKEGIGEEGMVEEEEVRSDLERGFDDIGGGPRENSVTSNDVVDQSPAADLIESSDSDESSDSIGAAALEFEQFLGTIRGGAGEEGESLMDSGDTAVKGWENDEVEADDENRFLETPPLAGAGGLARDGAIPQGDGEVMAQKPAVGEVLRGEALTPSREGGGSTTGVGASSAEERPSEGELEKGRGRRVEAASERDCRRHSSDDDDDGGGGGGGSGDGGGDADNASDMDEDEEGEKEEEKVEEGELEEDMGSDLERDFDGILGGPRRNNVTSNGVVDQSPAANTIEKSDSDESSDSIAASALDFEQFLGTIKGSVGGRRGRLDMDAEGTGVADADNDEEGFLEAPPLTGAGSVARDGAMAQDDAEVLAQKPVFGGLLHGKAVTTSREGGSSRSGLRSFDEKSSEGELERGRERTVAAAASVRNCRSHSSNDAGGGHGGGRSGGDANNAGDVGEDEEQEEKGEERDMEEEEMGSDLERDFDDTLGESEQNSVTPNDVVDQSPAAEAVESSDGDESSDSIGSAALEFEQFLDTIKDRVGGGRGSNMGAKGAAVEVSENGELEADDEEGFLETPLLAGAGVFARDGAMSREGDLLGQKPVVKGLLHGKAVSPSREGGSSTSEVDALSSDEGPSESKLEKGRKRRVAAAASERDCRPRSSDDASGRGCGGGGGGANNAGNTSEDEGQEREEETGEEREVEVEEVGSDIERDFDGVLGEPGQNSVAPNGMVDQSLAADAIETSDSDESSDSVGSAALKFEQFLDTIKGGVGGKGGSIMYAKGTAVGDSGSDKANAGDEEAVLEASPLERAIDLARDGVPDGELLAQKPVVAELVHGQSVTPSRDQGGAASTADASSSDGGPCEDDLEKERVVGVAAAAATEHDYEPHSSYDDAGGGGGGGGGGGDDGDDCAGDMGEDELAEQGDEDEDVGSDLDRDFDDILQEPRQNSDTSVVYQSPAASTTESSDSDESSNSVGAAALEFEQFWGTIRGGVGAKGGSLMGAKDVHNYRSEADDKEAFFEASPLEGAGDLAHGGVLPQSDGEVRAQEPVVVEDRVHGQTLTSSRDGGGAASAADASSSDQGPDEGEVEKGRPNGAVAAATERDYEPHSSDDDAGGGGCDDDAAGGGCDDSASDMEEDEEEEAGSDLERDFDGILDEPRRNSVASADAVDRSRAANTMESSDSDESSDSIGAAALEFEQFLGTIKGGVGGKGGSDMQAERVDNDELEPDDEEASTEASPLEGAGHPVHDGGLPQGDGEVRAQEHAVEDLVHGQALTPIREEGGATSVREASSCNEGPSEGKLEKGRASRVAGAAIGRDYEPHSSGDDADGVVGGGGHDDAGDVQENEVEEVGSNFEAKDVESDLERGFDDILEEPEQNSVTSDDVVGQSPVANTIDMVRSPMRMGVAPSHSLREVDGREVEEREVGERSSESSESGDSDSSLEEQSDDDQAIKGFEDFLSGL